MTGKKSWNRLEDLPISEKAKKVYLSGWVAVDAAIKARYDRSGIFVWEKLDKSKCSRSDLAAEDAVIREISKFDPDAAFLVEEETRESGGKILDISNYSSLVYSEPSLWVIDPIDDTESFVNCKYGWTHNISNFHKGVLNIGITIAPEWVGGYSVVAELGRGTFFQKGKGSSFMKVRVDEWNGFPSTLQLGYGRQFAMDPYTDWFKNVEDGCPDRMRQVVSCGLGLAFTACGGDAYFLHGYSHGQVYPWDSSPGILQITEAGGKVVLNRSDGNNGIKRLKGIDIEYFNPSKPTTGFVAGNIHAVDYVQSKNMQLFFPESGLQVRARTHSAAS